jgi:oligoendopeptidase F
MAQTTLPSRGEVAHEHTWNAESVYPTPAAWEADYKAVEGIFPALQQYQGRVGESAATLADALAAREDLSRRVGVVNFYAQMMSAVDSTNQESVAMAGRANGLYGRYMGAIAFVEPEILALGQQKVNEWVASEPRLAPYTHYFDNLFRRQAHVRSAEVEELLGMAADPFYSVESTMDVLTGADMKFKDAVSSDGQPFAVAQGTINELLSNPDREVRRTGWENYMDSYLAFKNTLASNLAVVIKRDALFTRARRYNSSLEGALFENNVPVEVFHNLVNTFRKNIPTWHKYWRVRRKALGVDALQPYDVWAPLAKDVPEVSYEQSVEWIGAGMKPLGDEYVNVLRRGCLEQRWVDIYPNQGKKLGAFSFGSPGTHPFINMSYAGNLGSLSTLAHELGHSMHSYLTWQTQPIIYSGYSMFVAEVASNFNQAMVRAHLFETNHDRNFQITLIEEAMSNFHRYFFIMPTLARFELATHERAERGEALTADVMIGLMADLFGEGYGSEMTFDRERTGITWATFPHLYANFYVFQYATGIAAAHALAGRILAGEPNAAEDYLSFLKAGSSRYAVDVLKRAGVDMATPDAVEKTFAVLAEYVDRLEKLTGN